MDIRTGSTLPMVPGLPLLGSLPAFQQDKVGFVRRNYERYGEMFGFSLGPKKVAMVIGPELSEQFFKRTDAELSITESMQWLVPVVGQVMSLGGQEMYLQHRKIIGPILGGSHMAQHVEAMVEETYLLMQHLGDVAIHFRHRGHHADPPKVVGRVFHLGYIRNQPFVKHDGGIGG